MKYTKEQLQNKFETLPEEIKKAVSSLETSNTIVDIGEKYKLHVDQIGHLIDEVGLLILGLKSSVDFINNISSETGIPQEKVRGIIDEINLKILSKIEPLARKMNEVRLKKEADEELTKPLGIVNSLEKEKEKGEEGGEDGEGGEEKTLERNKILDEIENPEKIENNFVETNSLENKKEIESKNQNNSVQDLKKQFNEKENLKDDIVENKLTQITKLPAKEKEIQVDPYREPLE